MNEDSRDRLDDLADNFLARYRRGERPAITEYIERHPELAEDLRDVLSALILMEQARPAPGPRTDSHSVPADTPFKLDRLGDYRILREIGRGGMGIVYEAEQESLGRQVALKLLPTHSRLDPRQLQRFEREARAAARLHHSNIVPVFGVGEQDGLHYYVMQFIPGLGLDQVLVELKRLRKSTSRTAVAAGGAATSFYGGNKGDVPATGSTRKIDHPSAAGSAEALITGQFQTTPSESPQPGSPSFNTRDSKQDVPLRSDSSSSESHPAREPSQINLSKRGYDYWRSVANIGIQVADALAYATSQGVQHRDIKPSNLLLDTHGTVWITDFGLAKASDSDDLTKSGDVVGTLRYLAPERLRGESDERSDLYSLGITLYELITHRPAFEEQDRSKLMGQILNEDPPRPKLLEPAIPLDLETIVLKAIAKDAKHRYATAAELATDLRRFLDDKPIRARRVSGAERAWRWCRRNPLVASLTSLLALFVIGIAATLGVAQLLRTERDRAVANEDRAKKAEGVTQDLLDRSLHAEREVQIRSYLAQAAAFRRSGQPGRRFQCLEQLRSAMALNPSNELREELRDEAIASMALIDLRAVDVASINRTRGATFDWLSNQYACIDEHTRIHVRHVDKLDERVLPGLGQADVSLSFSSTGQYLFASPLNGGMTQIWHIESGRPILSEPPHGSPLVSFSPDDRHVAIGLRAGFICVYELPSGVEKYRMAAGGLPADIAFNPDGRRLAIALPGTRVGIWEFDRDSVMDELPQLDGRVRSVAWHPQGRRLALGIEVPSRAEVWDVISKERLATFEGHSQDVLVVRFDHTGNLLGTWSVDGLTRLWDPHTARQLVAWPEGTVASGLGNNDRIIGHLYRANHPQKIEVVTEHEYRTFASGLVLGEGSYFDGGLSHDGRLVAVAMIDGVRIWDLISGNVLAHLGIQKATSVFFSRDGKELITSGRDGLVRWPIKLNSTLDAMNLGPPHPIPLPISTSVASFHPAGRSVGISSDPARRGWVLDLATEKVTGTVEPHEMMTNLQVSGDRNWAASYGWHSNSVKVWNLRTGEIAKEFNFEASAIVRFSPDDKHLIISRASDCVFYEVGSWQPVRTMIRQFCPYPGPVAFSPDGSVIALELSSAVISLVDAATGRTLAKLEDPHRDRGRWMDFTPDGSRLVVVSTYARAIHVWELAKIRRQLAAMGLDWESSPIPPSHPAGLPPTINVDLGELGPLGDALRIKQLAKRQFDAAQSHIDAKRWADAATALKRSIELSPLNATYHNGVAWFFATCPDPQFRDKSLALHHADRAIELSPAVPEAWNTLGVARYRMSQWQSAVDALTEAERLEPDTYLGHNAFFLAMAHWQLGEKEAARRWYGRAMEWLRSSVRPVRDHEELERFQKEAEDLVAAPPSQ